MSADDKLIKIRSQIEFYFGDANFRVDEFLRGQSMLNDGLVPISTILSFERMKKLGAVVEDVKQALNGSDVVEVYDDSIKKIETEEYISYMMNRDIDRRVVHIGGFNKENTLEDIKEILFPHIEPVLVRMRRERNKEFSGNVFAELRSEEEAEKAIEKKISVTLLSDRYDGEMSKKLKNEKYLVIQRKLDYLRGKEKRLAEKAEREAREALEKDFVPRLFTYESCDELSIEMVRKLVENTAFVDTGKKVVRMKFAEEFEEKTFEKDGKSVVLKKMRNDEALEYCKCIKVVPKKLKKMQRETNVLKT